MPLGTARLSASLLSLLALAGTAAAQPAPEPAPAPPATETVIPVPPGSPVIVETPAATTVIVNPTPAAVPPAPPSAAPAPVAPGAAPPAPQNENWADVSHINGQLVPVGQRNDYVYRFRKTNVSANPMGWVLGFYGVSVSHAISNNIAIRGDINYMRPFLGDTKSVEIGVGFPLYLRRTYQGAFLEPGFIVRTWGDDRQCYDGSGYSYDCGENTDTTIGPQVLAGWHWTWDSGWNVAVAAGFGRDLSDDDEDEYDDDELPFFNGYFRFGYAF